jgi:hypothetical protein
VWLCLRKVRKIERSFEKKRRNKRHDKIIMVYFLKKETKNSFLKSFDNASKDNKLRGARIKLEKMWLLTL